jgi:hypothetical protein
LKAGVSSEVAIKGRVEIILNRRGIFESDIYVETQSYGPPVRAAQRPCHRSQSGNGQNSARPAAVCHFQQGGETGSGQGGRMEKSQTAPNAKAVAAKLPVSNAAPVPPPISSISAWI